MAKKKQPENEQVHTGEVFVTPIEEVMPDSMLPYAEFVLLDRAIPRVEDGLKPVQRRILFTMYEMGLTPDKPHKKSARIVGDCMGKYHPHGDSSVYDAMVRMAQEFNMRMKLVDGHGNFGSVDGDPPAAMRYTEARLDPLALEMLADIEKETVPFCLNFDDSLKEPELLPARFPNLLVNGSSGIAVGLATNIPTHNMTEVISGAIALIDNPNITLAEMMKYIPAPDFSTGGIIIKNELVQAYETGRGKITVMAKYRIEDAGNGKKHIVIYELPYQVNKVKFLQSIVELQEKQHGVLDFIQNVTDESDRTGMRAVVTLKKGADVGSIVATLLKYTDMQTTFGINLVAIADGKPKQLSLMQILSYYVEYQRQVVLRRTKFDLQQAKDRCHILEGLIIAVRNIDEVIEIIKKAESVTDAREKLIKRFELTERQAQAILDLRLARLTKLEIFKLEQELEELRKLIKKLTAIVESKAKQMAVVKSELSAIMKKYPCPRKTEIVDSFDDVKVESDDKTAKEGEIVTGGTSEVVLASTGDDRFKCVLATEFASKAISGITAKSKPNKILVEAVKSATDKVLVAFTNFGNCYRISMSTIPICTLADKGFTFQELAPDALKGEKAIRFFSDGELQKPGFMFFFTKQGKVKRTERKEYFVVKSSYQAIKLDEGDELVNVEFEDDNRLTTMFFVTKKGMCLNAFKTEVSKQGRIAMGVKGISLKDGDEVVYASQTDADSYIILGTRAGKFKRVACSSIGVQNKDTKGVTIVDVSNDNGLLFVNCVREGYVIAVENDDGSVYEVSTDDVGVFDRVKEGGSLSINGVKLNPVRAYALKYKKKTD